MQHNQVRRILAYTSLRQHTVMELVAAGIAVVYTPYIALAQTAYNDASQAATTLLVGLGPIPWTHTENVFSKRVETGPGDRPVIVPCWKQEQVTTSSILTASDVRIVTASPLVFDQVVKTELTSQMTVLTQGAQNCSTKITLPSGAAQSTSFTRSSSVAVSNSVTNAQAYSFNFSVAIESLVKLGGTVQLTNSATTGTVDTNSYQNQVTRTANASPALPPQTAYGVTFEIWPVNYTANFHATVVVDANLSPNDKGWSNLSSVFPMEKRTFTINGVLLFVDASDGVTIGYDLTFDPSACPVGGGDVVVPIPPSDVLSKLDQHNTKITVLRPQ